MDQGLTEVQFFFLLILHLLPSCQLEHNAADKLDDRQVNFLCDRCKGVTILWINGSNTET